MNVRDESHWMSTASGTRFDLTDPKPQDVHLTDIAHALSHLCRWTGHTWELYSVAQHSVLVAEHVPDRLKPLALLHDAHEAYLGDLSRPVRDCLTRGRGEFQALKAWIDRAIFRRFGLDWPCHADFRTIKVADDRALATEARDLVNTDGEPWWEAIAKPFPSTLAGARPRVARAAFLDYAKLLGLQER